MWGIKTQAVFIKSRPLRIVSVGDWSPYSKVAFYFTNVERTPSSCSQYGQSCWAVNVSVHSAALKDIVWLGTATIADGAFLWNGPYPDFVRSRHFYAVLAVADYGAYGVWSSPFGWYMGPRRGIPDYPQ